MNRRFSKVVASLVVACTSSAPISIWAQGSDAADVDYGKGVDAFFAGRSSEADVCLSQAIGSLSNDPLPYYFRALSRLRLGRSIEARVDMQIGAELEARMPNRFAVGKVLERVQGPDRLLVERYRHAARPNSPMTERPAVATSPSKSATIERRADSDAAVLRDRRFVPLDEFLQPGTPRSFAVPDVMPANVITAAPSAAKSSVDQNTSSGDQKKAATATSAEPIADPFGDDAAHAAPPQTPAAKTPAPRTAAPKLPVPPQPSQPSQPTQPSQPAEKPEAERENPFQ